MPEVLSGLPVIGVAKRYGVARQAVSRWITRYRTDRIAGLANRSHAPRQRPWRTNSEIKAVISELRRAHRRWGPRWLVLQLDRRGYPGVPVYGLPVLVRHQLIEPVSGHRRRGQYGRWQRPVPMRLWHGRADGTVATLSLVPVGLTSPKPLTRRARGSTFR